MLIRHNEDKLLILRAFVHEPLVSHSVCSLVIPARAKTDLSRHNRKCGQAVCRITGSPPVAKHALAPYRGRRGPSYTGAPACDMFHA